MSVDVGVAALKILCIIPFDQSIQYTHPLNRKNVLPEGGYPLLIHGHQSLILSLLLHLDQSFKERGCASPNLGVESHLHTAYEILSIPPS